MLELSFKLHEVKDEKKMPTILTLIRAKTYGYCLT